MGRFDRDNKGGGKPFGKGNFGGPRQMHKAVCSKCGNDCEVPFVPTGDRPVLCSNCFKNQGDGGRPNRDFNRPANRQMHSANCAKCGNKCEVPFVPTAGKPIYCDQCFSKGGNAGAKGGSGGGGITREQFDQLNSKLDRILRALGPAAAVSSAPEKKSAPVVAKSETAPGKKAVKSAPAKKKVAAKKLAKKAKK